MQAVLKSVSAGSVLAVTMMAGIVVIGWLLLTDYLYWKKCAKWCAKRGLKCVRVETQNGGYGYVAHDPVRVRWYQIPSDFGELDESMSVGARMREFDWKGADKVAVEKDGRTIPLEFVKKEEDQERRD